MKDTLPTADVQDQVAQAFAFRHATKVFDPSQSIPDDKWDALLDALVTTPSSFGLQPWKFLIIDDAEIRGQLREVSWGQSQVTDADKLVVFATRTDMTPADTRRWLECLSEAHGQELDELAGLGKVIDLRQRRPCRGSRVAGSRRADVLRHIDEKLVGPAMVNGLGNQTRLSKNPTRLESQFKVPGTPHARRL